MVIRAVGPAYLFFIDVESEEGWSGGPVLDLACGHVLGVITGRYCFSSHDYTIAWTLP